jgi:hypothetical protein
MSADWKQEPTADDLIDAAEASLQEAIDIAKATCDILDGKPVDKETCECARCGRNHWKLGNPPRQAKRDPPLSDIDTYPPPLHPAFSIQRLFDKIGMRLVNHLAEMKPNYDDSITGFNECWDIVRHAFEEEIAPASRQAKRKWDQYPRSQD